MPLRHCIKCNKVICEGRAQFYIEPYCNMCNGCRDAALLGEGIPGKDAKRKDE